MKSYINVLADFHDAPIEKNVVIPYPTEELEKKLKAVARIGKQVISPETVGSGDVAVIAMESELPKFNKKAAFVTVGGGLLNKAFEGTLLGKKVGDFYVTEVEDKPVKVTIKQISRTIFPEPSDEMVQAYAETHDEYKGICTLEEYKERVVNDYFEEAHERATFDALNQCIEYLLTHSDFEFNDDELQEVVGSYMESVQESLEEQCKSSMDDLTEKEMLALFDVHSKEEAMNLITSSAEREIATVLILAELHDADATDLTMDEVYGTFMDYGPIETFIKKTITIKEER